MRKEKFKFFGRIPGEPGPRYHDAPGAEAVDIARGLFCFVYVHPVLKNWVVAEKVSGLRIGDGPNKATAIKRARGAVKIFGVDATVNIVLDEMEKRGGE